jgi:hypothetical protein
VTTYDDQMGAAIRAQLEHVAASQRIFRQGWGRQQWIEDAELQMNHPEGSVRDLLNGHPRAMLAQISEDRATIETLLDGIDDAIGHLGSEVRTASAQRALNALQVARDEVTS